MSVARLDFTKRSSALVKRDELPSPPGYIAQPDECVQIMTDKLQASKEGVVMQIALGPGKALMSTAFMLWMSGSSIQIFSIYATGNALVNPIKGLLAVHASFQQFEKEDGVSLFLPKAIFVALQVLSLAVALYKCSTMGLLPLTSADWVAFLPKKVLMESAGMSV